MTLSIQTGLSGILAAQTALNLTGQNVANVETAGFARRTLSLASAYASNSGGVVVGDVRRVTSDIVQARLYTQTAASSQSEVTGAYLQQIESLLNEPGDDGLNALLDEFFQGFADLGLDPENAALRAQVTETASRLADTISQLRAEIASVLDSVTSDIQTS
ncbi:MAG TPA: hypothetical protein P5137_08935, partial [Candidatus Brocadiia bacterium]|nr:hypothetical protein [Candidatus Brocadiia bacterium]